jgi:hypothetical protein
MGLETATYIHELVNTNPVGATDTKAQGDDHIRLLKTTLSNTFPNVEGAVTASHTELNILDGLTASTTELNYVDGVTSAIQTQLNAKLATNGDGSALTNLNASALASGTVAAARLPITLAAGSYTPTISNIVGGFSVTARAAHYTRVGNTVTVSGTVNIGSGASGNFRMSLPIASNFTSSYDAGGCAESDFTGRHGLFLADTANDVVLLFVTSGGSSGDQGYSYSYQVL